MKLRELAAKLLSKPDQEAEVQFLVFNKEDGGIICCDLEGPSTTQIMKAVSNGKGSHALVP